MNTAKNNIMLTKTKQHSVIYKFIALLIIMATCTTVNASNLAITGITFTMLASDQIQIQIELTGPAIEPKIFSTDNPARIALDFTNVKNALNKKNFSFNQGAVTNLYVAEAANKVRIVVNLLEATPFTTKVIGNKVLLTLNRTRSDNINPAPKNSPLIEKPLASDLIPKQTMSGLDFKRGDKGEGRLLIYLANPNTLANSKVEAGKVIINLTNTHLPENLSKFLDVSEFGTPIKSINTVSTHQNTQITISTLNELYDYSLFQSEGLLTIEFRPLSYEEKAALDRARVKYTGERLSLNFQDIEIRNVIAILAEFTKQNVVAGDDVTGNITLKLDDVPWDEALDFIMMTKELGKFESGNVTLISPLDKIKDYKKKQQETAAVVEQIDPLITEYIKIDYARAENIRNVLNGRDTGIFGSCGAPQLATQGGATGQMGQAGALGGMGQGAMNQIGSVGQTGSINQAGSGSQEKNSGFGFLSARGSTVVDTRTNTLIVRETTKRLEDIKKLIHKLDIPVRQVMIEARVAIASTNFTQTLGVKFGAAKTKSNPFAIGGTLTSVAPTTGTTAANNNLLVDLGAAAIASSPPGALGMTLASGADYVLNLELQALQAEGKAEILSNPRVMTMDRCTAAMMQGVEIPVTTPAALGSPPTTTYTPAVLELDVTPQITPNGSVIMNLLVKKDSQNTTTNPVSGNPGIDTRQVKTSVLVEDGETVVLGGVYENQNTSGKNKIPFFADLPGIGFLFTNSTLNKVNTELLIFITPKIIKNNVETN